MLDLNLLIALIRSSFSFSISSNFILNFSESSSATKFTGPILSLCIINFSKAKLDSSIPCISIDKSIISLNLSGVILSFS